MKQVHMAVHDLCCTTATHGRKEQTAPLGMIQGKLMVHPSLFMTAAKAVRTLAEFMATDKALAGCSKNVTIYGQAFHHVHAFASVLQVTV